MGYNTIIDANVWKFSLINHSIERSFGNPQMFRDLLDGIEGF